MARCRGPHPFGRSGKLIFGVLRVFRVKSTGPRAREKKYARRRMDFRSLFSEFLGWGLEHAAESQPNSFPNFYGDRPVPIGQEWSDDRFPLNEADSSVIFSMKLQLTAYFQKKKKKLFFIGTWGGRFVEDWHVQNGILNLV